MTSVELPYVTVSFQAPVVYYEYREGAELDTAEIRELVALAEKLSWSRPYVTFSDVRKRLSVTPSAQRILNEPGQMPFFRGAAVLVSSGRMGFAINFTTRFHKKNYPFRAFTSREKALHWLNALPLEEHRM